MKPVVKRLRDQQRRWWPTPSIVIAVAALFVVLGGSAVAANGLIHAGDIAPGAVTSRAIRRRGGASKPQRRHAGTVRRRSRPGWRQGRLRLERRSWQQRSPRA